MATLLLIHGGWCGSWVWERPRPELHSLNLAFVATDLPGHASQQRRMLWQVSLDDYTDSVKSAAEAIEGPVVAVAHSMAGLVITAAASKSPEIFEQLISLSAFAPVTG